jgi:PAS domain S-box-containing protein
LATIDALVIVLDPEGRIVLFNHKCQELTGYRESDAKGRLIWDFLIPPRHVEETRNNFRELVAGHFSGAHVHPWRTKAGTELLIRWHSTTIPDSGKSSWVVATGIDITDTAQQQEELQRLGSLFSNHPWPLVQLDRQGLITYCNRAALQALNKRRLLGENWRKLCPGLNEAAFDRFLRSSSAQPLSIEARLGPKLYVFDHYSSVERGSVHVFGREVTVERDSVEKLKDVDVLFRALYENTPDAVFWLDAKGTLQDCNPAAEKLFGYRRSELVGKNIGRLRLLSPRQAAALSRIPSGRGAGPEEFEVLRKDGRRRNVQAYRMPLKRDGKPEVLVVAHDISEVKRENDELAKLRDQAREFTATKRSFPRDQLETVARLLNRFGRDLTMPLGTIKNSAYILETALGASPDERLSNHVRIVSSIAGRIAQIAESFPAALCMTAPQRRPVDVASLVSDVLKEVKLWPGVKLEQEVPSGLPPVQVDSGQITRVLTSVIMNAQEAMPNGGALSVKVAAETDKVVILVADTGKGISSADQSKVFQPFYTTRPETVGLGLLWAKEIVAANEGRIEFESRIGRGTTFRLSLPAKASPPRAASEPASTLEVEG